MSENLTLRVEGRREARRALKRLEVEHDEVLDARPVEIGEAIVRLATENPDLFRLKLREVRSENKSAHQESAGQNSGEHQ